MEAKHTNGPWFVYPLYPDRFVVGNYAPSGTCRVTADCSPKRCVTGCGDETMTEEECSANAHLIAAAPDLYEASKALLKEYVTLADSFWNAETEPAVVMTRAAIAKAEGR